MKGLFYYILLFSWWNACLQAQVKEQTAHLHIAAVDGVSFMVHINGVAQHQEATTAIIIQNIPSPYCLINITTAENNTSAIEQTIYIKPFTNYWYELSTKQEQFFPLLYVKESHSTICSFNEANQPSEVTKVTYQAKAVDNSNLLPLVDNALEEQAREQYMKVLADSEQILQHRQCSTFLNEQVWEQWMEKLNAHFFDREKMALAKRLISSQCLTKQQFRELLQVFDFEKTRLDVAKFAYHYLSHSVDKTVVKESLSFQSSIDDWTSYVASVGKGY